MVQRSALRNWLTFGKQKGYSPLQACRDVGRSLPESELEACVEMVGARVLRQQQIELEATQSKMRDEATAVREIVGRAAAGDSSAMDQCQWKVGGMQRELPAWDDCKQQVRAAQSPPNEISARAAR